jgi:hypothetical protein
VGLLPVEAASPVVAPAAEAQAAPSVPAESPATQTSTPEAEATVEPAEGQAAHEIATRKADEWNRVDPGPPGTEYSAIDFLPGEKDPRYAKASDEDLMRLAEAAFEEGDSFTVDEAMDELAERYPHANLPVGSQPSNPDTFFRDLRNKVDRARGVIAVEPVRNELPSGAPNAQSLTPIEEPNANLAPSDALPAQAEPGSPAPAHGFDAAPAQAQQVPAAPAEGETDTAVSVAKEAWQMTQAEHRQMMADRVTLPELKQRELQGGTYSSDSQHYTAVRRAVREGLPVPPEVLADYPELQVQPVSGVTSAPEPTAAPPAVDSAPVPPGARDTGAVSPPAPAPTSEVLSTFPGEENTEAVVAKVQDGYSVVVRDKDSGDFADEARIFPTQGEAEAFAKTIAPAEQTRTEPNKPEPDRTAEPSTTTEQAAEPEDIRKISGKEVVAESATSPDPRLAQIEAHRAKAQELMAQARKLNPRARKPLLDQAEKEVEEAGRLREEMEGKPVPAEVLAEYPDLQKPTAVSPEAQGEKEPESKREIPSLGETGRDIYQGWKRVSGDPMPGSIVVGHAIGAGEFDWRGDKIVRLFHKKSKTGYVSTYRDATPQEIEDLHHAIDMGAFQVEQRARYGAGGVREFTNAGEVQKVFHQATGRPLPEWLETDAGKKWQRRLDESMARHAAETESPADETDAPSENAPAAKAPASLAYQNPQGLWIFRNGISQPIGKFSSHEAYARTAGKSEAQLMKEGAIRVRGGNVEAWLPRDLNTPAGRRALELASQYDPYGNVTVSYRGPSEKASFATYNKPDLEDSGFDLKRTREGIAGAAAMQGRPVKGDAVAAPIPKGVLRLKDAPVQEDSLLQGSEYWGRAESKPSSVEGHPALMVNNSGIEVIGVKMGPTGAGVSATGTHGLTLNREEQKHILDAAKSVYSPTADALDKALLKIARQIRTINPSLKPLVVLQTGESIPDWGLVRNAREESNHALQLLLPGGLKSLPTKLIEGTELGKRAAASLNNLLGYAALRPGSPR